VAVGLGGLLMQKSPFLVVLSGCEVPGFATAEENLSNMATVDGGVL
jgi:hypothetical protein